MSYLAAECAEILWVLSDFHLFDGFTEGSTITGSIFTNNSDLLGAFSLENLTRENFKTQIYHKCHSRSDLKSFTNTNPFNLDPFQSYIFELSAVMSQIYSDIWLEKFLTIVVSWDYHEEKEVAWSADVIASRPTITNLIKERENSNYRLLRKTDGKLSLTRNLRQNKTSIKTEFW